MNHHLKDGAHGASPGQSAGSKISYGTAAGPPHSMGTAAGLGQHAMTHEVLALVMATHPARLGIAPTGF